MTIDIQMLFPEECELQETISVGAIQTNIDFEAAWREVGGPPMAEGEAQRALVQIERAVSWFGHDQEYPEVLVLPELSVARAHRHILREICCATGSLVIAGLDYFQDFAGGSVRNEAVLFVPSRWPRKEPSRSCQELIVGKTYPARTEEELLQDAGWTFQRDPNLWVFETGQYGRFGVCICYDLMDAARLLMYRGQVHHLFVLAYNKDTNSFNHICEAACRTLFCNIIVCNTGHFGGSLALSPYYKPYMRPSFRIEGRRLSAVESAELPVASLARAWEGEQFGDGDNRLKQLPPGFNEEVVLERQDATVPPLVIFQ